jgi:hypothetical protein
MLLKDTIKSAFADVPQPDEGNITTCSGQGPDEVLAYFRGRTCDGHSAQQLRHQRSALSWLTEDALLYYLPAFLVALVEDPEEADMATDILWKFSVPSGHKTRDLDAFYRTIARLNARQRDAILLVFEYLRSRRMSSDEDITALRTAFDTHANTVR